MLSERLQSEFGATVEVVAASQSDAIDGVVPQVVAAPRDEDAARELVSWCGREKMAFVTRGGGTKLEIGAPPTRCELLISSHHLNRIIEHDAGNATVQAQSGITLNALNDVVMKHKQFVPLDDALTPSLSTLGGAVAANAFGPSRLKWGAPRDLVVGLSAVLSDGRVVKAGAKVVKNVSGYDLPKLFVGSFGTLGFITQVTLRTRPDDAANQTWQRVDDWPRTLTLAREILQGPLEPTLLRATSQGENWLLSARFQGVASSVAAQIERLPPSQDTAPEAFSETVWRVRAHLPLQRAASWIGRAQEEGARLVQWDCGLGIVRAGFDSLRLIALLRHEAEKSNGFLIVERAPIELKTPALVWGGKRGDWVLMQRLKGTFDAAGVCSPGRFYGGL